ncbi:tripartite motif-containing protein 66 [Lampris incognitus]|uniref:tripartite motif-containing protein 66 n=1 Tax=Lampris incognitus TaxID=2546036 RepID=UPI0024B564BC|nr:tripartite motif-containing protein 66 [Lampris incognitus]
MEKSCSECSESRLAQSLCTFCNKWLCYQCTDMHQHQRPVTTSQYSDVHQQPRPATAQHPDVHPRAPGSLPSSEQGPGSYPRSLLMCHSHRQEPLELFCESCDLLCCSSCHLSAHSNHRLVRVGKALQDQHWLFDGLTAQMEERRSAVENTAKQIEDRLHGVKTMQRRAENQIKMAKMIMMNELNKRANLLIEKLEKISEDFQRCLEDQLQGAIEMCGQLDHMQKFITWATTQHHRSPVLFSKAMISLQIQQLLEPSLYSDSWAPLKIRFNWDASYWTQQISSFGQLAVEGGTYSFPEGVACHSILRPQPISCLALPPVCPKGREQNCGYQPCCQPQICCLHGLPPQPDLPGMDKTHLEATPYSSSYVQPAVTSASLHQSHQLQRCWAPESSLTLQCPPPSSPPQTAGPISVSPSSHGSMSQPQPTTSQPQSQPKSYPYHQHQMENHTNADIVRPSQDQIQGQCQDTLLASDAQLQHLGQTALDKGVVTQENWAQGWKGEHTHGQKVALGGSRVRNGGQQYEGKEQTPVQQPFHVSPTAEPGLLKDQQEARPPLSLRNHRDGKRSTSLEMSVTARQLGADAQSSRLGSGSACGRRRSRSQSIPAELAAASSTSFSAERFSGCARSLETRSMDKCGTVDPRQRRASDGVVHSAAWITSPSTPPTRGQSSPSTPLTRGQSSPSAPLTRGQSSPSTPSSRGQSTLSLSPLLHYKKEPDNAYGCANKKAEYKAKEKYNISRKTQDDSETEGHRDSGSLRVPVVCLERLKILVSRLPPHGRRQSDPLPATGLERSCAFPHQGAWGERRTDGIAGGSGTVRTTLSFTTRPYAEGQNLSQSTMPPATSEFHSQSKQKCRQEFSSQDLSADPKYVPLLYSALDLDSDSDPRSVSELELVSEPDLGLDEQLESDSQLESNTQLDSLSEAECESVANEELVALGQMKPSEEADTIGESEPSVEYEVDPELDAGEGPGFNEQLDADSESGNAEESEVQADSDSCFQAEPDSDILSDPPPDVESEPDLESEPDPMTDEPQPLRSDQEEEALAGPGQRPLLIANPGLQRGYKGPAEAQPDQGCDEMESEDYCAVCLIGGNLLCCDRCPKVFHLSCHIPPLLSFPVGDWVCTMCRDVTHPEMEYDYENQRTSGEHKPAHGLLPCDQRRCERLTLLILSNILSSPFHEPVSPLARHYYQIIKRPMDLSVIRARLNKDNTRHYGSPDEFVADVYLMFRNCAKFNYPDSEVAQAGRNLEAFFSSKLKEVFPDRVFPMAEEDSDSDEYDEVYRSSESGFPWPGRREQCHRKRKRRHSLSSRRHHF